MGSRNRTTFVLFAIFAVLFAFYWFVQKDKPVPADDPSTVPPEVIQVTSYDPASLQEVSWKYQNGSGKAVKDGSGTWKLTEPPAIVADSAKVSEYIQALSNLSSEQKYLTSEVSLEDAGINAPFLTVTVKVSDSQTDTLKFGKKTVDGEYYFTHKNNEDFVTLVSSFLVDELKKDPYTLTPSANSPSPAASIIP